MLSSHWDGWNTMEGRHLVFAYAFVLLLQGGYFAWIVRTWIKLDHTRLERAKKSARPV